MQVQEIAIAAIQRANEKTVAALAATLSFRPFRRRNTSVAKTRLAARSMDSQALVGNHDVIMVGRPSLEALVIVGQVRSIRALDIEGEVAVE